MYKFEPLAKKHFQILYQRLRCPQIQEWWGPEKDWDGFEKRHAGLVMIICSYRQHRGMDIDRVIYSSSEYGLKQI